MSVLVRGLVFSTAFLAGPVLALANAPAVPDGIALVLTAPGTDVDAVVEASGGRVVVPASSAFATLAVAEHPAFLQDLTEHGAWLVRDGTLFARICGVSK